MAPRRKRAVKEVEKPVETEEESEVEEQQMDEDEEMLRIEEHNGDSVPTAMDEESAPAGVSLQFNQPLSWKSGRPISTGDLLSRLDKLSKELSVMEQEDCDSSSLTGVAKELAHQNLLGHKDKGVRALTACCLVDILSLSAPDAPFTPGQLKDIFTLFITTILPALSDPSNAYNVQHMYVLNSLAEVKSIILLADIPNSDPLILHLFVLFFDMLRGGTPKSSSGDQMSKATEYNMGVLLVTLVDEAATLPAEVIDTIISQFLRASAPTKSKQSAEVDNKQATLLAKDFSPSYRLAKKICDECPEKMARYISQYFNEVILDAGVGDSALGKPRKSVADIDSDDEGENAGPTDADLKELDKAHNLLRELWRASSPVLQNVIPQLEAELSAENVHLRLLATETLGDIVSGIGAAGPPPAPHHDPAAYPPIRLSDPPLPPSQSALTIPMSPESFPQTYHQVYLGFLQRRNDRSAVIRSGWTTACGRILTTSAGGIGLSRDEEHTLITSLAERLADNEEKVRLTAVRAVATFTFRDIVTKLAPHGDINKPGSLLCSLADRLRDKKSTVRMEAVTLVAKIWGVAAAEITAGEESVVNALGQIPTKLYDLVYVNDPELNVQLEHITYEQLLPLSFPPVKKNPGELDVDRLRTERILTMISYLKGRSVDGFFMIQKRQKQYRHVIAALLDACDKYNGGVGETPQITSTLKSLIDWLVHLTPDKIRAAQDLWKFAKLHDRRCYQLIRFMIAPESDFPTVHKAIKEFIKKIEANAAAPAGMMETLLPMLYRCSSIIYNKSNLPTILAFSRNDMDVYSVTAHEVLKQISDINPEVFKAQIKELCKVLVEQTPSATKPNDHGSVQTLKACAGYARKYPKEIPSDRKFVKTLMSFAEYGTPPKSAKYAVNVLIQSSERKEMHAKDLLSRATTDFEYGSEHFLTKLATISQVALLMPKIVEESAEDVLNITTQEILMKVRRPASEDDPDWLNDTQLDEECVAKCWSLKTLVNRIRSCSGEDVDQLAKPVYRLLNRLVKQDGELMEDVKTPAHHRSRLRLYAANMLLKLCATSKDLDSFLTPKDFDNLSFVAQDACYNVRLGFLEKLKKYLASNRLSPRFYTILFLVAFEPEPKLRSEMIAFIQSRVKVFRAQKRQILELALPRLISLLAHHPDYSSEAEDLADTAKYLLVYVSNVVGEENLGLVYKYAERVKGLRDAISPEGSERLYVLSDLTQAILRKWQLKKGWSLQAYSGKTGVTKDLFAPLPDHQTAQEIAEKSFIPEQMEDLLDGIIRKSSSKKKRKSDNNGDAPAAKKVRTSVPRPQKPKTPRKSKASKASTTPSSAAPDSERRRSGRSAAKSTYADRDSSDDDEEMLDGVSRWEYEDGRIEKEEDSEDDGSEDEIMSNAENGNGQTKPDVPVDSEPEEEPAPEEDASSQTLTPISPNPPKKKPSQMPAISKSIPEPETGAEGDDEGDDQIESQIPPQKATRNRKVTALKKSKALSTPVVESEADMPTPKAKTNTRSRRAASGSTPKESTTSDTVESGALAGEAAPASGELGMGVEKTKYIEPASEPKEKKGNTEDKAMAIPTRTRSTRARKES